MHDMLFCPQCGSVDIRISLEMSPVRVEATCMFCGLRHIKEVEVEGEKTEVEEIPGLGAFIIVTTEGTYHGPLELPWCDMYDEYFHGVFNSPQFVCGRVTRWDEETGEVIVVCQVGDPDTILDEFAKVN